MAASNKDLTISKATAQARRVLDRIVPGLGAARSRVTSRNSWDSERDVPTIVTFIEFPESIAPSICRELSAELYKLHGWWGSKVETGQITITRKVA